MHETKPETLINANLIPVLQYQNELLVELVANTARIAKSIEDISNRGVNTFEQNTP